MIPIMCWWIGFFVNMLFIIDFCISKRIINDIKRYDINLNSKIHLTNSRVRNITVLVLGILSNILFFIISFLSFIVFSIFLSDEFLNFFINPFFYFIVGGFFLFISFDYHLIKNGIKI